MIDVIASGLGIVAILVSIVSHNFVLSLTSLVATISAVSHSTVLLYDNAVEVRNGFAAADAICGVLVTITCAFAMRLHTTAVGMFRILWLVTLVTSSNSYAFFSNLIDQQYLPNDVSIIALGGSTGLLVCSSIYLKCRHSRQRQSRREQQENQEQQEDQEQQEEEQQASDYRHTIAESLLVGGSFALRFDRDLRRVVHVSVGYSVWHVACWMTICICATL